MEKPGKFVNILCGFAMILFILEIIFPAILSFSRIQCASNLKTYLSAFSIYHQENKKYVDVKNWNDLLTPFIENRASELNCPKDKTGPCSYAMNENIPSDAKELPSDLVLLFESAPGWNQTGGADDVVTDRHDKPGANIAFADGHVEFVKAEDIPNLCWMVETKK